MGHVTAPGKGAHLVERVAERLRETGDGSGSAALLSHHDHIPNPGLKPTPAAFVPVNDAVPPKIPVQPAAAVDLRTLETAGRVSWDRRDRISEQFRIAQIELLRTARDPAADRQIANLIMVTSSKPGEGKSVISLNLACAMARYGGGGVVLVDADAAREDCLSRRLGLSSHPGLLDLALDGHRDARSVLVPTAFDNLTILPVGAAMQQRAELSATAPIATTASRIGRHLADRIVILDAPPCLSSSDPSALAPLVGQIAFVVEAEQTQRSEVEASLDLLQGCPSVLLLLNKVKFTSNYTFGEYS